MADTRARESLKLGGVEIAFDIPGAFLKSKPSARETLRAPVRFSGFFSEVYRFGQQLLLSVHESLESEHTKFGIDIVRCCWNFIQFFNPSHLKSVRNGSWNRKIWFQGRWQKRTGLLLQAIAINWKGAVRNSLWIQRPYPNSGRHSQQWFNSWKL